MSADTYKRFLFREWETRKGKYMNYFIMILIVYEVIFTVLRVSSTCFIFPIY